MIMIMIMINCSAKDFCKKELIGRKYWNHRSHCHFSCDGNGRQRCFNICKSNNAALYNTTGIGTSMSIFNNFEKNPMQISSIQQISQLRFQFQLHNSKTLSHHFYLQKFWLNYHSNFATKIKTKTNTETKTKTNIDTDTSNSSISIRIVGNLESQTLSFVTDVPLQFCHPVEYISSEEASKYPLARDIFALNGITKLIIGRDFLTAEKSAEACWENLKNNIVEVLNDFLKHSISYCCSLTRPKEIEKKVRNLIETRVKPAILKEGGDISFEGIKDDGTVLVRLLGSCSLCKGASTTLLTGIESLVYYYFPMLKTVQDISKIVEETD